jgi:hypothetical protein
MTKTSTNATCPTCGQTHVVEVCVEHDTLPFSAPVPAKRCPEAGCTVELCEECVPNGKAVSCESCAAAVCQDHINECYCGCRCDWCRACWEVHMAQNAAEKHAGDYDDQHHASRL